jgi:hypothetical protein
MKCANIVSTSENRTTTAFILLLKVRNYKDEKVYNGVMFMHRIVKINLLESGSVTQYFG